MKVSICSDLHLEFGSLSLENKDQSNVLILAGDIFIGVDLHQYDDAFEHVRSQQIHDFFINTCLQYEYVILIAGNHTFYHGDFQTEIPKIKQYLKYIPNLYILDNETLEIDDYLFIGSTIWTDFNDEDKETMEWAFNNMNDYHVIKNDDTILLPEKILEKHKQDKQFIKETIENNPNKQIIVITHHCPTYQSIPAYKLDYGLKNGCYHSNLESLMDNVVLWAFGHIHDRHAYYLNNTLLVNNTRGYIRYQDCANTFELKSFDLKNLPSKETILTDKYWYFYPE
jgi:hypothetical protein